MMISSLHGRLESLGTTWAVIDVNGVGFQVFMPTPTLSSLGAIGDKINLRTQLVVREDSISLYGFATEEELELFQMVTGVSGIGPKLGLAVLSSNTVERVCTAIAGGDVELLKTIPGIGKKTAERIVLELKDKIGAGLLTAKGITLAPESGDIIAALVSLGYSVAEAGKAVSAVSASPASSLEERIKLALQYLGKQA